jgi:hypothetical protein
MIINEELNPEWFERDRQRAAIIQTEPRPRADKGLKRGAYHSKLDSSYKSHIMRCNKQGADNGLTEEEFTAMTQRPCAYCGGVSDIALTRINPRYGYDTDNTKPACSGCRTLKGFQSDEQFIKQVRRIGLHLDPSRY